MRLEVQYPDGEKEILEFKQKVVTIGRGSENDLQLAIEGVSRRHLKIEEIKNQFFITDVGSSNGTLLNDEKIEPHKPVEFSTFFPVIFGVGISIRLLNEDDMVKPVNTTTAHRKGAQNAASLTRSLLAENAAVDPTGKAGAERDKTNPEMQLSEKMRKKHKSRSNKNQSYITGFLVICVTYYFLFIYGREEEVQDNMVIETSRELPPLNNQAKPKIAAPVVVELKPEDILNKEKCLSDLEKKYCNALNLKDYYEGFVVIDRRLYLVLNYPEQIKSFQFLNPLSGLDNQNLAARIEAEKRLQKPEESGDILTVSQESRLSQGAFVSLLMSEDFYNTLTVEQNIDEIFLVIFKRVEGIPRISYTETIKLSQVIELGKKQLILPIQILFGSGLYKEYNEVTSGLVNTIR
ncbi:MAG: FHA domain-containing protein [Bacteriovoracaceae bacterium]|nr:FHA domain-containing protein [Bacteriovoracaceae bacterium]